jgi:quercetin dioxygenase-like cupin family protein
MLDPPAFPPKVHAIKHQPKSHRYFFDVAIGSICLSGADTGGAYCLLEVNLASGIGVPRHTHTREDEAYFVLAGELEVIVGGEKFVLRAGDTLMAPRGIPHQLRNSGNVENHYLLVFSPAGFEEFVRMTALPAPDDATAPTEPPAAAVRNVHELAAEYGIQFD